MKRIKIQNFLFLIFLFFVRGEGGVGVGGRAGQMEMLAGMGEIIFIWDTLYQPNTHCFTFSSRYSIEQTLLIACTRTALEIYRRDVTPTE